MSVWKQLAVTSQIDEQIERLKQALGYKSKWRVIKEALDLLEEKIADKQRQFVTKTLQTLIELDVRETRNTRPLLAITYQILSSPHLTEEEKDMIIVSMIETASKLKRQYEAKHIAEQEEVKAEEEALSFFEKLEKAGGIRNE